MSVANTTDMTKIFCLGCKGTGRIIGRQGMGVMVDHTACSGRGYFSCPRLVWCYLCKAYHPPPPCKSNK